MTQSLRNPDSYKPQRPRLSRITALVLAAAAWHGGVAGLGCADKPEKKWWKVNGLTKHDIQALERAYAKRLKKDPDSIRCCYSWDGQNVALKAVGCNVDTGEFFLEVDGIAVGNYQRLENGRYGVDIHMCDLSVRVGHDNTPGFESWLSAKTYAVNMIMRYIQNFDVRP